MRSIEQIESEARKAGEKCREPYVVKDTDHFPPFPFPDMGDYRPEDWEMVETYFVDSTGFGEPDELALTPEEFKKILKPGYGYGVIKVGQFQVVVGEFTHVLR
jgi:hypothetical protein